MEENSTDNVTIDILGDICLAWSRQKGDSLVYIAEGINSALGVADYRIANLEAPILEREDISPSSKEGSSANLYMNKEHVPFVESLSIDAYTLANNHIGDYGESGIESTIKLLEMLNKKYVGTSLNIENTYMPLRLEIERNKISVFSFCENEFGIVQEGKIGAAGFRVGIIKQLLESEKNLADKIIVVFHGGIEHYPFPTPNQRERYRWLVDIGADVVVGMHSHCPVGYELYKGKWIFYGIGNFYFPREMPILYENWYMGYIVRLRINREGDLSVKTIPYKFNDVGTDFNLLDVKAGTKYLEEISKPILKANEINKLFKGWVAYNGGNIYNTLKHSIEKDCDRFAFNVVKNLLTCEAHMELLKEYVNREYYEPNTDYGKYIEKIKHYINCWSILGMKNTDNEKHGDTVILWGFTAMSIANLHRLKKTEGIQIILVDKDIKKQGFEFEGYLIQDPNQLFPQYKEAVFYIGTSFDAFRMIAKDLILKGVDEERILYEAKVSLDNG